MRSQKHMKDSERKYVKLVVERGGIAHRVAGSGCGKNSICDVITTEKGTTYAVEIKSTEKNKITLTAKEISNINKMIKEAKKHPPLKTKLAIHWKRRGWQEINLNERTELKRIRYENGNS